jgi:hypothetical protein
MSISEHKMRSLETHRRCVMNKISGILPSNSRLASVDFSKASPTRKGHPNIGQPEVETQMRAAPKSVLKHSGGVYSQVMDMRQKGREQSVQAGKIEDAYFTSKVSPEIQEGFDENREMLIQDTIPVEASNEVIEEVGTNLSVVA